MIDVYIEQGHKIGADEKRYEDITDLIGRGVVGDPYKAVDQLSDFVSSYGTDHLVLKMIGPGMDHEDTLQALRLLSEDVLPRL